MLGRATAICWLFTSVLRAAPPPGSIQIVKPVDNSTSDNSTFELDFAVENVEAQDGLIPIVYFNSNNPVPMGSFEKRYTVTVNELPIGNYTIKIVLISKNTRVPVGIETVARFRRVASAAELALVPRAEPAVDVYNESQRYTAGNDPSNRDLGHSLLQEAALRGNAQALLDLGQMYLYGEHGHKLNISKAVKLIATASKLENSDAMYMLAQLYSIGVPSAGLAPNETKAVELLRSCAMYKKNGWCRMSLAYARHAHSSPLGCLLRALGRVRQRFARMPWLWTALLYVPPCDRARATKSCVAFVVLRRPAPQRRCNTHVVLHCAKVPLRDWAWGHEELRRSCDELPLGRRHRHWLQSRVLTPRPVVTHPDPVQMWEG